MAIGLSGPVLPEYDVNDCLAQLRAKIAAVDGLDAVYGYRSAPTELAAAAVVTAIADVPGDTPDGLSMAYDYIVDVLVRIDGDYEAAETRLNHVCSGIWRAVWGANLPTWSDCYAYAPSAKPASPPDMVGWRRGILYVRVIPQ